ncbi:MAG: hypothetical protein WCO71_07670, partial [Pseudomonadota bacterium]
ENSLRTLIKSSPLVPAIHFSCKMRQKTPKAPFLAGRIALNISLILRYSCIKHGCAAIMSSPFIIGTKIAKPLFAN